MSDDLRSMKCVPCEGGVPALTDAETKALLEQTPGWEARAARLHRRYQLKDFLAAMAFLNEVARIAEAEGHHPDFCVHWNQVDFTLWTHAVGGLSKNDFILAAKIDAAAKAAVG